MSDLSNLLGDVYGATSSPDGPPVRHEPPASERAPEWSSESSLDRAFTGWVPGEAPKADDGLAEALASALAPIPAPVISAPAPIVAPAPTFAPLPAASLAESLSEMTPAAARAPWTAPINLTTPSPVLEMAGVGAARSWMPGDDDIFPAGKKSKK